MLAIPIARRVRRSSTTAKRQHKEAEMSNRLWQRPGAAKQGKFVFIALAIVLGLILMACGGPATAPAVPAGAKPGELTVEPCTFKTDIGEYAADCGTLVVPENRAKADSRLIALPVIRVR